MYKSKSRTRADPSHRSLKNQTQTEIQMMNSISRQISNDGFLNLHSSNIRQFDNAEEASSPRRRKENFVCLNNLVSVLKSGLSRVLILNISQNGIKSINKLFCMTFT